MISPTEKVGQAPHGVTSVYDQVVRVAMDRLGHSGYGPLKQVRCDYCDGVLSLHGSVPTFYLKQIAQVAVKDLQHVRQVDNQIVVSYAGHG